LIQLQEISRKKPKSNEIVNNKFMVTNILNLRTARSKGVPVGVKTSKDTASRFLAFLNNRHPKIKFTMELEEN